MTSGGAPPLDTLLALSVTHPVSVNADSIPISDNELDVIFKKEQKGEVRIASPGALRTFRLGDTLQHLSALILAAGLLCLPALFNGYPFLYPDTIECLLVGPSILANSSVE